MKYFIASINMDVVVVSIYSIENSTILPLPFVEQKKFYIHQGYVFNFFARQFNGDADFKILAMIC